MKYLLLLSCLTLYGDEEIAASFSKKEVESHYNELDHLKSQIATLEKQIADLNKNKDQLMQTMVQSKQAQFATVEFIKNEVAALKGQLETVSSKAASNEVAFWNKTKKNPEMAPEESCSIPCATFDPAYNYPSRVNVQCSWDLWADASFTYWQASQDNMEVGVLSNQIDQGASAYGTFIKTETSFSPGFKVGTGVKFNYDYWDLHTEYTWFRNHTSFSTTIPESLSFFADYYQIWPTVGSEEVLQDAAFSSLTSSWTVNMDIVDAVLGRSYFVGTALTFHPFAGLRSAFIRQKRRTDYINTVPEITHASVPSANIIQNSHSWSLGPEIGIDLNWTVCGGFRFISSVEADLLYTRYTRIHNSDNNPSYDPIGVIANTERNLGCIRAHADMELGLGYGFHSWCDKYYIDFSAIYGFQVFFDQNMFHSWYGSDSIRQGLSMNGNLYVQGLTASADFHF
jgi:hypothetical protein